jgi:hypothetical protein
MKRLICACSFLTALAAPASAAVLLDNTGTVANYSAGLGGGGRHAFTFTTSSAWTITDLKVILAGNNGSPQTNRTLTAELFSGAITPSSSVLATASATNLSLLARDDANLGTDDATTITAVGSGWAISAGTYTIALSTDFSGYLANTSISSYPTGAGVTYGGRYYSPDDGATWNGPFTLSPPTTSATAWLQVSGTPAGGGASVPDAGPGPALALLLGGLGLRQWRLTRRAGAKA